MKKRVLVFVLLFSFSVILFSAKAVSAINENKVNYHGQPVIDSDLDGLTDQGEIQIYHTDPNNPDTNGDGILDGAEVLNGIDPLDANSFSKLSQAANAAPAPRAIPWNWYAVRAAGLVAFFLLYLNIFFGLAIRFPGLNRIIKPIYSLETHKDMSLYSLFFVFIHLAFLLADKVMPFSLRDILIPFASSYSPFFVGIGVISFYLMLVLIITSYFRKYIPDKLWRIIHYANFILYMIVITHALFLGTDLKGRIPSQIFIGANLFLLALFVVSIGLAMAKHIRQKAQAEPRPGQPAAN